MSLNIVINIVLTSNDFLTPHLIVKTYSWNELMIKRIMKIVNIVSHTFVKKNNKYVIIKNAINDKAFYPFYQPIVNAKDKHVVGYESLARWLSYGKVIPPNEFIPSIEKFKLMEAFTNLIIDNVIEDLDKFPDHIWISINITAEHLESDILLNKLAQLDWPTPHRLKFELTENKNIANRKKALEVVQILKNKGYGLKLDDYGSGFCNAKNLLCLGFTEIKIDRVFIGDTTIPSVQNNILLSLIDFTKRCNIDVIVEGVEEHYQADFLIKHGVYFHQGFLYSKPKALADILQEPFAMQS